MKTRMFLLKLLVLVVIGLGILTSSSEGGFCRVKIQDGKLSSGGNCGNSRENSVLKELDAKLEARRLKAIKCKSPPSIPNGAATGCDDDKSVDDVCTLECNTGYSMSGSASATCEDDLDGNSEGSWNTGDSACSDVDECASALDNNCHANAACTNNVGSFTCACNFGYFGNGITCNDVDECVSEADNNCHANAACTNNVGSFSCVCNWGYFGNGITCNDIDECASAAGNNCHADATCTNNAGSFTCACNSGYFGNGQTCDDVDECASTADNNCHADATCTNNVGSFTCACNSGFFGYEITCNDIDECASAADNNCHADATCKNNVGSFTCACNLGYFGNGETCNECASTTDNNCHADATQACTSNVGPFTCACNSGYFGNGETCNPCEIFLNGVCYWTRVGSEMLNYIDGGAVGGQICANNGSELAYFPDEQAYNAVMENIRSKFPEGRDLVLAYTGLVFDPVTNKITYPIEDTYVKWRPGAPYWTGIREGSILLEYTTSVYLIVSSNPDYQNQGMVNNNRSPAYTAVVCQVMKP